VGIEILRSEIEEAPLSVFPHVSRIGHELGLVIPVETREFQPLRIYVSRLAVFESSLHHVIHLKHIAYIAALLRAHCLGIVINVLEYVFVVGFEPMFYPLGGIFCS